MKFLVSRGRFRNSEFDLWTPRIFRRDFALVGIIVVIVLVMLVIVFVIFDFETRIVSLNSRPGPPFRSSRGPLSGRSENGPNRPRACRRPKCLDLNKGHKGKREGFWRRSEPAISASPTVLFSVALKFDFCRTSAVKLRIFFFAMSLASIYHTQSVSSKNA